MLVVMQEGATEEQVEAVIERMVEMGFDVHRSTGVIHTVLGGVGGKEEFDLAVFEVMDGVKEAHRIVSPYKLASRHFRPGGTVVKVGGVEFGGEQLVVVAGPAVVESREQIEATAAAGAKAGAHVLAAFCPRAASFQGLGEDGLRMLRDAAGRNGLLVASEVMDDSEIPMVSGYADILTVGAHHMQNYNLLRELGKQRKPVLLNRGISAAIEELLLSADYDVVLCERGIRTFETYTRYTMDISAIPIVKKLSHLPILADPSRGTGRRDKVAAMGRAAVAAGADGLVVEVHPNPDHAQSDGAQSLRFEQLEELMAQLRMMAPAVGRKL